MPNISRWKFYNVISLKCFFFNCTSLYSLPDISKWNTKNIQEIDGMFSNCSSLISLPDLSKWNTQNLKYMKWLLSDCISLSLCPDITNWNNFNKDDIYDKFDYKEIEKFNDLYYQYNTFKNPNEEDYDKFFNDSEYYGKFKVEKYERLYN